MLIEYGANARENSGIPPLTLLSYFPAEERIVVAEGLLRNSADVNAENGQGETPVMSAVRLGDPALVQLFVEHGANLGVVDMFNDTPQSFARKTTLELQGRIEQLPVDALLEERKALEEAHQRYAEVDVLLARLNAPDAPHERVASGMDRLLGYLEGGRGKGRLPAPGILDAINKAGRGDDDERLGR